MGPRTGCCVRPQIRQSLRLLLWRLPNDSLSRHRLRQYRRFPHQPLMQCLDQMHEGPILWGPDQIYSRNPGAHSRRCCAIRLSACCYIVWWTRGQCQDSSAQFPGASYAPDLRYFRRQNGHLLGMVGPCSVDRRAPSPCRFNAKPMICQVLTTARVDPM